MNNGSSPFLSLTMKWISVQMLQITLIIQYTWLLVLRYSICITYVSNTDSSLHKRYKKSW